MNIQISIINIMSIGSKQDAKGLTSISSLSLYYL